MKKSTLIAVAVFAVLVVGVVWSMSRKPERGVSRLSLAGVDAETITKVEISGKNPVVLTRDGETWQVESGKEADGSLVKRMVESIPKIDTTDLVTRSSDRFAELEVDEEKGAHVLAFASGERVADFWVGKSASGGSYIRAGGEVYVAKQIYASTFSRQASAWLQRKLFDTKIADVSKVTVALAGKPAYTLVSKDNNWDLEDASVLPQGFRFDKNQARSLVSTLVNARATDILDELPAPVAGTLGDEADVLAFFVEEGEGDAASVTRKELRLGGMDEEKKTVYAQVAGKKDFVTLAEHTAKSLRKQPADFRDLRMMELDTTKVTRISVVDGTRRLTLVKKGADWTIGSSSEKIPDDFQLDPALVTRRVSGLANARAAKLMKVSTSSAGLTRPAATVTATLEDGSSARLAFGRATKDDNRDGYYAAGNADSAVYFVTTWTRDNLTGGIDKLKKRADPSGFGDLDPKALQGLPPDVRAGLIKQMRQKQQQQQLIERLQRQAQSKAKSP